MTLGPQHHAKFHPDQISGFVFVHAWSWLGYFGFFILSTTKTSRRTNFNAEYAQSFTRFRANTTLLR